MNTYLQNRTILTYDDVAAYPEGTSDEPLVAVTTYDTSIISEYSKYDMVEITGTTIFVRDTIAKKLALIESKLKKSGYRLKIAYGYRHPSVQQKYFTARRSAIAEIHPEMSDQELDRYTHNFVAVPAIGGHPAGAAIDVTLLTADSQPIDMGTSIADYTDVDKVKTDYDSLTPEQVANRKVLHDAMVAEGFAPFYGEWWHFSYGDREWAVFYGKTAIYGMIDFTV